MSMADLSALFTMGHNGVTYLGTWCFGVDSPRYGRMMLISMVVDDQDRKRLTEVVAERHAELTAGPMVSALPTPSESEARLYEVMSYPRIPQYFQRHQW